MNNNDSLFSFDKLVEFGLGMSMARQMFEVMNKTMAGMQIPGSAATIPQPAPKPIYVAFDGKAVGPLSEMEFNRMVTEKRITNTTLAWMPGMTAWTPVEQLPELLKIIALTPPPPPVAN